MMKTKNLATTLLLVSLAAPSCFALSEVQTKSIKKAIGSVATPEMPAKAVELVNNAPKEDQESVAVAAVRAAIYRSRPSASVVVAAVSKAKPELAASVVKTAAEMESGQSDSIATAAITAAPEAKAHIVATSMAVAAAPAPLATATTVGAPASFRETPVASSAFAFDRASDAHPVSVTIEQFNHPINEHSGGNGHGRFENSPPHEGRPPGLYGQPAHHGPPDFVDYTKPRNR